MKIHVFLPGVLLTVLLSFPAPASAEADIPRNEVANNLDHEGFMQMLLDFEGLCGPIHLAECRVMNPSPCINDIRHDMRVCTSYEAYCGLYKTPSQCMRSMYEEELHPSNTPPSPPAFPPPPVIWINGQAYTYPCDPVPLKREAQSLTKDKSKPDKGASTQDFLIRPKLNSN